MVAEKARPRGHGHRSRVGGKGCKQLRERVVESADGVGKTHGDGRLPEEQSGLGVAHGGCLNAPVTSHRLDEQAVYAIDLIASAKCTR